MIAADLIARARAMSCADIIASRGYWLRKAGREFIGPCPVCGGRDRFGINIHKNLWNCRQCGMGGGVIDLVEHVDRVDFQSAIEILTGERGSEPRASARFHASAIKSDDGDRTRRALAIWGDARRIDGSPAWRHLALREIDLGEMPIGVDRVLRWHPACPWESGRSGCMVALYTDVITGEPKAIHRTAISPAGEKIGRKALGPTTGCVIRLWPDESVTDGLLAGEGLETTLAAATNIQHKDTLLQPAWATGSAGLMSSFPVLSGIEALTLLVDRDASQAGEKAAAACSARWTEAGREVIRLVPDQVGTDFNDIARGE